MVSRGHDHLTTPQHKGVQGPSCFLVRHFESGASLRMRMKTTAKMPKIRRPSTVHLYFSTPETLLR